MNNVTPRKGMGVFLWTLLILIPTLLSFRPEPVVPVSQASQLMKGPFMALRAGSTASPSRVPPPEEFSQVGTENVTFIFNYYGPWPSQAKTAFEYAANIWASQINSSVPIEIDAYWEPLDPDFLVFSRPFHVYDNFPDAPFPDTWYPIALANHLTGTDLNGSDPEIEAEFNSSLSNWYFGTDGNTPQDKYDFVTMGMHAIGLGLAFHSSMDVSGGQGSWGWNTGYPVIFDHFGVNGSDQSLLDTSLFPNPSSVLAAQLTSNNIFFNGPNAREANGGTNPKLYAPNPWEPGLSFLHLDEDTYPPGTANALMTPFTDWGEANHNPGPITLGIFKDIGWINIAPPVADFDAWPLSGDAPLTVSMHSNASGTITSCLWDYGDGETGSSCAAYHDHTYTNAGSYTVSLTVSGPGGSDTKTRSNYITVSNSDTEPPTVNWISPVGNEQVYEAACGATVGLEVSASDAISGVNRVEFWRWDAVNNVWVAIGVDNSPPYQVNLDVCTLNMEWNQVSAYAFDNAGNWAKKYIWIYRIEAPPVADFDATPLSGTAPLLVSFHNTSTGTITSCSWTYGDGATGTSCAASHNHTYSIAGTYSVILTVTGPGGSDTKTRNNYITVSTPTPTATPPPSGTVCGQVKWGTSCTGGSLYPIFFPCGSDTRHLWQPLSAITPDAFYRIYNTTFETMAPLCTVEYGDVTSRLANWSQYEQINSCEVCGSPPPTTFSISGRVTSTTSGAIPDVSVIATGPTNKSTTTDSNGNYTLDGLITGTYILTPSKSFYAFDPVTRTVTVPLNATGKNFNGDKFPIVFVHGWKPLGSCDPVDPNDYFEKVDDDLITAGYDVVEYAFLETSPCKTLPLIKNVDKLMDAIDLATTPTNPKVILIAHSMGGLVSRAYIEDKNLYRGDVAALFTFGSAHLGVPVHPILKFIGPEAGAVGLGFYCVVLQQPVACEISDVGMTVFNGNHKKNDDVSYHVISGNVPLFLRNALGILILGSNDGIIPQSSGVGLSGTLDRFETDEAHNDLFTYDKYHYFNSYMSWVQCLKPVLIDGQKANCGSVSTQQLTTSDMPEESQDTPFVYGTLSAGQTVARPISLEGGPTLFAAQWQTGTVAVTLVDPNGQVIDPTFAASNPDSVMYNADATIATYYFPNAIRGQWQLKLQGTAVPPEGSKYMTFATFYSYSSLTLTGNTDSDQYAPGATAIIAATVSGSPTSATVTATIFDANGTSKNINLSATGGGNYQTTYSVPNVPGYAEVRLAATGTTASGAPFERGRSLIFKISTGGGRKVYLPIITK